MFKKLTKKILNKLGIEVELKVNSNIEDFEYNEKTGDFRIYLKSAYVESKDIQFLEDIRKEIEKNG